MPPPGINRMEIVEWLRAINWRTVKVSDIISGCAEGYLGDWLGRGEEMDAVIKYRLKQCSDCKLFKNSGCDPTNQIEHVSTGKLVSGCGCNIQCKTALKSSECPAGKWLAVN